MDKWQDKSVLIVEDSVVQREHLVDLVKMLNFGTVLQACDGIDALKVIAGAVGGVVDLVLTDLDMPNMDGIELVRHLAEGQLTKHLIVISARDPRMLEVVEEMGLENAGMHLIGTVVKPVRLNDLIDKLKTVEPEISSSVKAPERARFNLAELELALEGGQFVPYFQPKVEIATGLIVGVEALARWQHPEFGVLAPVHFIPRIEGSPLMEPFTLSIIGQSLHELSTWKRAGQTLKMSINLSAENLSDRGFIERVVQLTNAHGIDADLVIWEVTETMVMSNLSQCLANLVRLRLKGFGLAMDDYGIGYSSMQQLSRCPFTELKIDRAFVDGASERPNRQAILESSIDMGHRLGVVTVAEGVEKLTDWELLQKLNCDIAQGYLIAKPMPGSELPGWCDLNREKLQALAGTKNKP